MKGLSNLINILTIVLKEKAITGIVDRLKKGGYLEVYKDSKDRRITCVLLTEKGKIALQTHKYSWDNTCKHLGNLSPAR